MITYSLSLGFLIYLFIIHIYMFSFQLGAADYIAVAENYHTVFISDIPMMSMRIRDKVFFIFLFLSFFSQFDKQISK